MADANTTAPKQPKVVNKSGTLKMTDEVAATKQTRDMSGRPMRKNTRRDRVKADNAPKEFEEITINIDRVSRTVKGGRRMRFKALVAVGNKKNKVWLQYAYERESGEIVSFVWGKRDLHTALSLKAELKRLNITYERIVSDHWESFAKAFADCEHIQGKAFTVVLKEIIVG